MTWAVPLALAATLALAGCDAMPGGGGSASHRVDRYVALGDSYTAGSGIGTPVGDAGAGCGQTTMNYPRLVAEKLGAELADASCAGASTGNSFTNQTVNGDQVWPAQLNFLNDETDLVTVSFGYNDFAFLTDALLSCVSAAAGSPLATACANAGEGTNTDTALLADEVGARLQRVLAQVEKRSPDALVLVVGYPQLVPASGSCEQLSLIEGSYDEARAKLGLLDDAMREAAEESGAGFVDVFGASDGHDICAGDEAWVNGPDQAPGIALPLHPFQREQDAIAQLVEDAVLGS